MCQKPPFSETTGGVQLDPTVATMSYAFPAGFNPGNTSGTVELTGNTGNTVKFIYTVSGGVLTITWQDMDSDAFNEFVGAEDAEFSVHIEGVFTSEKIEFNDSVTVDVTIDQHAHGVDVNKRATYDPDTNTVKYTVTAFSSGPNTEVHIGDTFSGTALSYNNDLEITSSKPGSMSAGSGYSINKKPGETFGILIPSMQHGETVTLTYSANVDLSKVSDNGQGSLGTFDETSNSVKAISRENPKGDESKVEGKDFENKIKISSVGKSGSAPVDSTNAGKKEIEWTITLNEEANVSLGGKNIKDTIETSDLMHYTGNGIHVEKYNKDGSSAGSYDVAWGESGLTDSKNGSNWTYKIPEADEGNYKYVITYKTEVDADKLVTDATVKNKVEDEYGSAEGGKDVGPSGTQVEATKTAKSSTVDVPNKKAETTWVITFTVPENGLDSVVVTDTFPAYSANTAIHDTLKEGTSIEVNPSLLTGERVDIDTESDPSKAVLTFYKTVDGEETTGLTGTGEVRTITITLTTETNNDYIEAAETASYAKKHINNALVKVNGQDIRKSDSVIYDFSEKTITKTASGKETLSILTEQGHNVYNPDGSYSHWEADKYVNLPAYQFQITLTGINDGVFDENNNIIITDTFDSRLKYENTGKDWDNQNSIIQKDLEGYGSWEKIGSTHDIVEASGSENTLTFTLNKDDLIYEDGTFAKVYRITYYLTVDEPGSSTTLI